jgi:hypothetical protein
MIGNHPTATILVSTGNRSNFGVVMQKLMEKVPGNPVKTSFEYREFQIHFLVDSTDSSTCFAAVTRGNFSRLFLPFGQAY